MDHKPHTDNQTDKPAELIPLTAKEIKALTSSGREAWNEAFGNQIEAKKWWRLAAFASFGCTMLSVGGLIRLGAMPKEIAYVLEHDQKGHVVNAGRLVDQKVTPEVFDAIYTEHLENYVRAWRTVSNDKTLRDQDWDNTFLWTAPGSSAQTFLNTWYAQHNPSTRIGDGEVATISITGSERQSQYSYWIWWTETVHTNDTTTEHKYRARMTFIPYAVIDLRLTEIALEEDHHV